MCTLEKGVQRVPLALGVETVKAAAGQSLFSHLPGGVQAAVEQPVFRLLPTVPQEERRFAKAAAVVACKLPVHR